jgi:hypothetical protein
MARQIEATDEEIDALVYELYGLTNEEIAIVGGGITETRFTDLRPSVGSVVERAYSGCFHTQRGLDRQPVAGIRGRL